MSSSENSSRFSFANAIIEHVLDEKKSSSPFTREYEVDPEEETRVIKMRTDKLVGKTVTGTLFMTGNRRIKYWLKWNHRKCDNIYVPADILKAIVGDSPVVGTKLMCTITELGPDSATAWRKHPQTKAVQLVKTFSDTVVADKSRFRARRPRFINSKLTSRDGSLGSWRSRNTVSTELSRGLSLSG